MTTTSSTSSTSSTSGTGYSNGRYWGLATGLDVDSIVKSLLTNDQSKIDKANQNKQTLEWKQQAYSDIISKLNTFESTYLDLTNNSGSCMLSTNTYNQYDATTTNSLLTVRGNSDATAGTYGIRIYQSAAVSTISGASFPSTITSTVPNATLSDLKTALSGKSMNVTVDGVVKTISFTDSDFSGSTDLAGLLNSKFTAAFGTGAQDASGNPICKIQASLSGNTLTIGSATGINAKIVLQGDPTANAMAPLGFTDLGIGNTYDLNQKFTSLPGVNITGADSDGNYNITLNNTSVQLNTNDSIADVLSKINNSSAGVSAKFSTASNSVVLTAKDSGAANDITFGSDTNSQAVSMGLLGNETKWTSHVNGRDAIFSLDGGKTTMTRGTNNFLIDGVTYTINGKVDSATDVGFTLTSDTSSTEDAITKFISAYNDLLDAIDAQTTTKPDKNYPPLTDAQKSSMKDTDITNWNNKAQQGVLFDDSTLNSIEDSLKSLVYQPVTTSDGKTMTLYGIGITTSYGSNGKLSITDKSKLETALAQNPNGVTDLFTKSSNVLYQIGGSDQKQRLSEEGIGRRIKDIIDSATTSAGVTKGSLVALIGDQNNTSKYGSSIYDQIKGINDDITNYTQEMKDKQNRLYNQFTNLETLMQQMNTQSSWLSQSLGSGS